LLEDSIKRGNELRKLGRFWGAYLRVREKKAKNNTRRGTVPERGGTTIEEREG